jgi:hypothetical protein
LTSKQIKTASETKYRYAQWPVELKTAGLLMDYVSDKMWLDMNDWKAFKPLSISLTNQATNCWIHSYLKKLRPNEQFLLQKTAFLTTLKERGYRPFSALDMQFRPMTSAIHAFEEEQSQTAALKQQQEQQKGQAASAATATAALQQQNAPLSIFGRPVIPLDFLKIQGIPAPNAGGAGAGGRSCRSFYFAPLHTWNRRHARFY